MPNATHHYSPHIYDQARIDLAITILEKESRKLFLGLPSEAWQAMDQSIRGWSENPTAYHLEDDGPRDFWDSFAAFMEGIKLKPTFTAWITAENAQWHKTALPIRKIQMSKPLESIKKIPNLDPHDYLTFGEVMDALANDPETLEEQKRISNQHSTDPTQDEYPIIVREVEDGLFRVMDGNRRTLSALLNVQTEIEAWVGRFDDAKPVNFWIPLNDMLQLVKVFAEATSTHNEQLQQAVAQVLKAYFTVSNVAEQAYEHRIGNQTEVAAQLLALARQQ